MLNIAVLISGTGSNLKSILEKQEKYNYKVSLVVSNKESATGLNFAKKFNIPVFTFKWDKNDKDLTIVQNQLKQFNCELIVLAGFMRILPEPFIQALQNRIINIHPSLLPKYPGLHTHQRVLDNNDEIHGATVHYVTAELDAGKIITQTIIKVPKSINKDTLAEQLLFREHSLLPYTIGLIGQNRVEWINNELYFDHKILTKPVIINDKPKS